MCGCAPLLFEQTVWLVRGREVVGCLILCGFFLVGITLRLLHSTHMAKLLTPAFNHQSETTGQERTKESSVLIAFICLFVS